MIKMLLKEAFAELLLFIVVMGIIISTLFIPDKEIKDETHTIIYCPHCGERIEFIIK